MSDPLRRKTIINDPVHGFITIPNQLIFDLIQHPWLQRLRRIKQLGLTEQVYPGAIHTRFHHALGAMYLMSLALDTLRAKGHYIWEAEYEAALVAILLHDIGHGPFSHALENSLLDNLPHEDISLLMIESLNKEMGGALSLALQIFKGTYHRKFLHQLVASQLDMDRLDYLQRDSFFTGVQEGAINPMRIIKMLDIVDDKLVVVEKGIYSIENFLVARRLMYWQVYMHKVTVSTEQMLLQAIRRAKDLFSSGKPVFATPALKVFLQEQVNKAIFTSHPRYLEAFAQLDDHDIWACIKMWQYENDAILSRLCQMLLSRKLCKVHISDEKIPKSEIKALRKKWAQQWKMSLAEAEYFVTYGKLTNAAYQPTQEGILILTRRGELKDVAQASDLPNIKALTKIVKKYFLCHPKDVSL
ncbi:MAG: HD domain-containing protein [Cytophagales bacterium]|nr:HD domain-containing protein [Bernardetiaceae bacterium]MDW8209987.1 HD domain-containing protein [Cytophagales bacterium]